WLVWIKFVSDRTKTVISLKKLLQRQQWTRSFGVVYVTTSIYPIHNSFQQGHWFSRLRLDAERLQLGRQFFGALQSLFFGSPFLLALPDDFAIGEDFHACGIEQPQLAVGHFKANFQAGANPTVHVRDLCQSLFLANPTVEFLVLRIVKVILFDSI